MTRVLYNDIARISSFQSSGCMTLYTKALSSAEASFALLALGRVGSLEAGERVKKSARGTLGRESMVISVKIVCNI